MARRDKRNSLIALAGFGLATAVAAWYGSRYSPKNPRIGAWYSSLNKPGYTPPNYVFPIVWTSLYALMAFSGWRVWRAEDSWRRSRALRLWAKQLLANAEWSKLFFGQRRPALALMDCIALESSIVRYIKTTYPLDRPAALMFVPYATWVGFAAVLNGDIARRNLSDIKNLARVA